MMSSKAIKTKKQKRQTNSKKPGKKKNYQQKQIKTKAKSRRNFIK